MARYDLFARRGAPFYAKRKEVPDEGFDIALDDMYSVKRSTPWTFCMVKGQTLPLQGWKIHVSATYQDAERVLSAVTKILVPLHVAFKYLSSPADVLKSLEKYADRIQAGKFITIYPQSEEDLTKIGHQLQSELKGYAGPVPLTDINLPECPVSFRYGAFKEMTTRDENGRLVPAIMTPSGEKIPDRRIAHPVIPPWVTVPHWMSAAAAERLHPTDEALDDLLRGYAIESVLHYSNAGGVYKVRCCDSSSGNEGNFAVMKEGRRYLGIDGNGHDGSERARHEGEILAKLSGSPYAPRLLDCREIGENFYLFEDYVGGMSLFDWVAKNYPFNFGRPVKEYLQTGSKLAHCIIAAVQDFHERGIELNDLQPRNIMVTESETIMFVDFECAENRSENKPSICAPGFFPLVKESAITEGVDVDSYALAETLMHIFCPTAPAAWCSDDYWQPRIAYVKSIFGDEIADLLNNIHSAIPQDLLTNMHLCCLSKSDVRDIDTINNLLVDGIRTARSKGYDAVYPGDTRQFQSETACLDFESGLAGVMFALGPDDNNAEQDMQMLEERALACSWASDGLFRGPAGVAWLLAQRGCLKSARTLFLRNVETDGEDLSIRDGLAGRYVALRSANLMKKSGGMFADILEMTADKLQREALSMSDSLSETLISSRFSGVNNIKGTGFFDGMSGFAYALCLLANDKKSRELLAISRELIRLEAQSLHEAEDGSLQILDRGRMLPYLAEGSAGTALSIILTKPHGELGCETDEIMRKVVRGARVKTCIDGGLFYGNAGLAAILALSGYRSESIEQIKVQARLHAFHLPGDQSGIAAIGKGDLGLSLDYATGSAGVIALLRWLQGKTASWLPAIDIPRPFDAERQ